MPPVANGTLRGDKSHVWKGQWKISQRELGKIFRQLGVSPMNHHLLAAGMALTIALSSLPAAEAPTRGLNTVVDVLGKLADPAAQADVLRGMVDALKGRRQ